MTFLLLQHCHLLVVGRHWCRVAVFDKAPVFVTLPVKWMLHVGMIPSSSSTGGAPVYVFGSHLCTLFKKPNYLLLRGNLNMLYIFTSCSKLECMLVSQRGNIRHKWSRQIPCWPAIPLLQLCLLPLWSLTPSPPTPWAFHSASTPNTR